MDSTFRFSLDMDIEKAEKADSRRLIRGYASTSDQDRQGESLLQKGLDITDFVNHGYFNYDHDNSIILGYPFSTCRVDNHGMWVEGEILKGIPAADRVWELATALKKCEAPRKLGFSVEGKVLQRGEGGRILKAKIFNVAITTNPVNTNCTWEAVVKSFSGEHSLGVVEKALESGYETNPENMEGGSVFRKESLEGDLHNLSYVIDDEEKKKILKQKLSTKKSLSANELTLYLQLTKGWSVQKAREFISKHIQTGGAQ